MTKSAICAGLIGLALNVSPAAEDPRLGIAPDNRNIHVRGSLEGLAKRLAGGGECRIAFLGGSITENVSGHTAMVPELLKEKFPNVRFSTKNMGWGSTCSTTGAFRVESQIFDGDDVDLLVVEFAVNDDQDAAHARRECIRGMEGIIRRVRRDHPACDIVMVHFVNPPILAKLQKGESPISIEAHEAVAEHYQVTSVNVAAEIAAAVDEERYSWDDYGGTHPGRFGYQVASAMIMAAIEGGLKAPGDGGGDGTPLPDPLDTQSYDRGSFVSPKEATLGDGWTVGAVGRELLPLGSIRETYEPFDLLRGDGVGAELTFEFSGRGVGAFILAGPDAGVVDASVDGGDPVRHDLFARHSRGLNYPRSVVFASDLPEGKHSLRLKISDGKNEASKGNTASILFFEVNGPESE